MGGSNPRRLSAGPRKWAAGAGFSLFALAAQAGGLQVAPVTLTLAAAQPSDGVWASNAGTSALQAQVRLYRWSQRNGEDVLEPSEDLAVSPPMMRVPEGGRQLVRVVRTRPPADGAVEESFRIVIDEVPQRAPREPTNGLQFLLRYSLPIFLQPAQIPAPEQLSWALRTRDGATFLEVKNEGGLHAQVADVAVVGAAGQRRVVHRGLLGYVLPGATMRWPVGVAAADGAGVWEAMINGRTVQPLPVAPVR